MRIERILVPLDGSDLATRALDFAITRAKVHEASIEVVFAVNRISVAMAAANPYGGADITPLLAALDQESDYILATGSDRVKAAGVHVERTQLDGLAAPAILQHMEHKRYDLVVMGTHGRRGFERFSLGSTAEGLLRASSVPVFVVPQRCTNPTRNRLERAIVAMDGSPAASAALRFACDLAQIERTRLVLCAVIEPMGPHGDDLDRSLFLEREKQERATELLNEAVAQTQALNVSGESLLLHGEAHSQILGLASSTNADCIFTGTHGRAGIPRFLLGSVAEGILRSSNVPVCTVRHR